MKQFYNILVQISPNNENSTRKKQIKNVQDWIYRPLGSREIKKKSVYSFAWHPVWILTQAVLVYCSVGQWITIDNIFKMIKFRKQILVDKIYNLTFSWQIRFLLGFLYNFLYNLILSCKKMALVIYKDAILSLNFQFVSLKINSRITVFF